MKTLAALRLAIFALAVCAFCAPASQSANRVYGTIFDSGGSPLPWSQVDLRTLQHSELATGWTDREGQFSIFTSVPEATYLITASGTDRKPYSGAATLRANASMPFVASLAAVPAPIEITAVSAYGSWPGYVQGKTSGVTGATHAVAVAIYVPGAGWWSKPTFESPCVPILPDGTWSCLITTGGADASATIVKAFLLPIGLCGDETLLSQGYECTPEAIHAAAVATAARLRPNPAQRRVQFSGREWLVKSSSEPVGPGPNYFSDSTENVWVDAQGKLHLKITYRSGHWQCAELVLVEPLGYGKYEFTIDSSVNNLDPMVVFGLFTYSEECGWPRGCNSEHREIDLEFSRWSVPGDPLNAQYVMQPWDCPGHRHRFTVPAGPVVTFFDWRPGTVDFGCAAAGSNFNWTFAAPANIPKPGQEQTRINLYLDGGTPPQSGQPTEVVISKFEYE